MEYVEKIEKMKFLRDKLYNDFNRSIDDYCKKIVKCSEFYDSEIINIGIVLARIVTCIEKEEYIFRNLLLKDGNKIVYSKVIILSGICEKIKNVDELNTVIGYGEALLLDLSDSYYGNFSFDVLRKPLYKFDEKNQKVDFQLSLKSFFYLKNFIDYLIMNKMSSNDDKYIFDLEDVERLSSEFVCNKINTLNEYLDLVNDSKKYEKKGEV